MNARCCGIAGTYGLKAREVRHRDGRRRRPVRPDRAPPARRRSRVRHRDVPLADRARPPSARPVHPIELLHRAVRPLGTRRWSASSSSPTARRSPRASSSWRARWAARSVAIEAAGGMDEPGALGHRRRARARGDRARDVRRRRARADGPRQRADERRDGGRDARRAADASLLSEAPLVEGAVAAAVAARGGASLEEVAAEARGALAMKAVAARRRGRRRGRGRRRRPPTAARRDAEDAPRGPQRDRPARAPGGALRRASRAASTPRSRVAKDGRRRARARARA